MTWTAVSTLRNVRTAAMAIACAGAALAAGQARAQCGTGGDCLAATGLPGCNILGCCESVCVIDPSCCLTGWDAGCVGTAKSICAVPGCAADLNGDGTVDGADLGVLLACWS